MKLLTLLLALASPITAQPLFTQTTNPPFDSGLAAIDGVKADFNGDGNLDLAFIDLGDRVNVLLGDGRGGFTAAAANQCRGVQPIAILTADFNGDGKADIALEYSLTGPPDYGQVLIQICLGDGQGGLIPYPPNGTLSPVLSGNRPGSMASGDFNGDGVIDLLVSNASGLVIQLGDGKGGFQPGPTLPAADSPIAVADFVGNRNSDIVAINREGLTVFVCDGKGGFTALPTNPYLAMPVKAASSIATADLNHDGFPDLVVGNSVLLGDGKGGFLLQKFLPYSIGETRNALSLVDFDGDGNIDLALTDGSQARILLGTGDGSFDAQPAAQFPQGRSPNFGISGDFNNDGRPDYLLSDGRVWLNTLQPIKLNPSTISFTTGTNPVPLTVPFSVIARSNQKWLTFANGMVSFEATGLAPGVYSGKINFSGAGFYGATLPVTLTVPTPSGTLSAAPGSPLAASGTYYSGDFDGDGKPDLLVYDGTAVRVWFGDGAGTFTPSTQTLPISGFSSIALADFNRDGHLDLVATPNSGPLQVYFGDGKGGFTAGPATSRLPYIYALGFPTPAVADFNLDGIPDVLAWGIVFLGDGKGSFREVVPAAQPGVTASVAVADFNGDGIPDVADTQLASSFVYIWLSDGKGGLKLSQRYDFSIGDPALGYITAADFNSDGILDLAITSAQYPGRVEFLYGNGKGVFAPVFGLRSLQLPDSQRLVAIASADFNGDGKSDLAVTSQEAGTTILFGDGHGGFTASGGGSLPIRSGTLVADLNGDGRPDLAGNGQGGLEILLGALAQPTVKLTQLPASPFDIGQTVSLLARVSPDPHAFQPSSAGQVTLADSGTAQGSKPAINGAAYFVVPYVPGTHNFTATYAGDSRNANAVGTLQVIESGTPTAIQALGNAFPLQAVVTDANNNPVPGVRVTFSAPTSGPGGIFAGGTATASVLTDSRGIATAPLLTANGIPGPYSVTATTTIGGFSCVFAETN